MARVAVVTGGTRGIGAAIAKALKAAGYTVAANYGGNDAAAQAFKAETGIPVYKWDVSSYEACEVARVGVWRLRERSAGLVDGVSILCAAHPFTFEPSAPASVGTRRGKADAPRRSSTWR